MTGAPAGIGRLNGELAANGRQQAAGQLPAWKAVSAGRQSAGAGAGSGDTGSDGTGSDGTGSVDGAELGRWRWRRGRARVRARASASRAPPWASARRPGPCPGAARGARASAAEASCRRTTTRPRRTPARTRLSRSERCERPTRMPARRTLEPGMPVTRKLTRSEPAAFGAYTASRASAVPRWATVAMTVRAAMRATVSGRRGKTGRHLRVCVVAPLGWSSFGGPADS